MASEGGKDPSKDIREMSTDIALTVQRGPAAQEISGNPQILLKY